jgi:drug/metabolite transporter (DMT)-like permease
MWRMNPTPTSESSISRPALPGVPRTPRLPAGACLALAMVTVGSTVVASRVIAAGLPPFTATALRLAVALPIFLALMRWRGERLPRPSPRDALLLALQALAGTVGYAVLLLAGMKRASAADAGVLAGSLPVVAALFSALVLGERPSRALVAATVLAGAGVVVIHLGPTAGPHSLAGNGLVLAAVACESLFLLLNKQLRTPVPPLAMSALMCGLGLAFTALPALGEAAWRQPADAPALLGVLYYALVPTVGGYLLWYAGAERASASEASLYTAVLPVSAVALAGLVLGEPVGPRQLAGVACVLAAIGAIALRGARGRVPKAPAPPAAPGAGVQGRPGGSS